MRLNLTTQQAKEAAHQVSVLLQAYDESGETVGTTADHQRRISAALTLVLADLTESGIQFVAGNLIADFNSRHNQNAQQFTVASSATPFGKPGVLVNANDQKTALAEFQRQLKQLSNGWLACWENTTGQMIAEMFLKGGDQ